MLEILRIAYLKRKLRIAYTRMTDIANDYDCGFSFLENVSPSFCRARARVNEIIRELKKVDKDCNLEELK